MSNDNNCELYRLLLEQLPVGVIITDTEGKMLFVNQSAENIRNIHKEKLLGRNIRDCHPKSSLENVNRAMENLCTETGFTYHRMVEDHKNNKYFLNTYSSILDESNTVKGIAVLTEDMTEKRKMDEERIQISQMQEETIRNIQIQYHNLLIGSLESITNLLEAKDVYTKSHSRRVADISTRIYEYQYGMNADSFDIKTAAFLHDIGKICIPDAILQKTTSLTEEEYTVVKKHPVIAADILMPLDSSNKLSKIVRHHHERFDGSGYPDGLAADEIPVGSKIIAIADTFDAMHSNRPYREAIPYERCVEEIKYQSGKQFDPEWVEIFCEMARTGSV